MRGVRATHRDDGRIHDLPAPRNDGADHDTQIALGIEARLPVGRTNETYLRQRLTLIPVTRPDHTATLTLGASVEVPALPFNAMGALRTLLLLTKSVYVRILS